MNKKCFLVMLVTVLTASYAISISVCLGLNVVGMHGDAVPAFSENSKIESKVGI